MKLHDFNRLCSRAQWNDGLCGNDEVCGEGGACGNDEVCGESGAGGNDEACGDGETACAKPENRGAIGEKNQEPYTGLI